MAMTAWAAKFCTSCDLLVGKGPNFLAGHGERADQFVVLQHWHEQNRPDTAEFDALQRSAIAVVRV